MMIAGKEAVALHWHVAYAEMQNGLFVGERFEDNLGEVAAEVARDVFDAACYVAMQKTGVPEPTWHRVTDNPIPTATNPFQEVKSYEERPGWKTSVRLYSCRYPHVAAEKKPVAAPQPSRALSTIHAPVLGRHGWQEVRCYADGGTIRRTPGCEATDSHATWRDGFAGRLAGSNATPPGYHRTLFLSPSWCDHTPLPPPRRHSQPAPADDQAQLALW